MRKLLATLAFGVGLAFGAPDAATAQQQDGLVNVMIGDITILENVDIAVAANLVANVCANLDVQAAVALLSAVDQDSQTRQACRIGRQGRGQSITITQN